MLDLKDVRRDPQAVADGLARRGFHFDVAGFETLDAQRKQADMESQALQNGFGFRVTSVPKAFDVPENEFFDPVYMTALFDAGWDENRAVDLLLEDGDHLTAWEETGKKNRKKQKQYVEDVEKAALERIRKAEKVDEKDEKRKTRKKSGGGSAAIVDELTDDEDDYEAW